MSNNFFLDNKDLRFQFEHGIDWEQIVQLTEADYKLPDGHQNLQEAMEFYLAVMDSVGDFAGEFIAPRAEAIDKEGNELRDGVVISGKAFNEVYEGLQERELLGMTIPREFGGSNCPLSVFFATGEVLGRADVSVMTHFGFHSGIAMSLLMFGAREKSITVEQGEIKSTRWDEEIMEIAAGEAWGSMVLTEPDAGSDLGRIRTRAVRQDGKWTITGEKIFITSGHGKYSVVLAKTDMEEPNPDPLKNLSLFLVPMFIEQDGKQVRNFEVSKVEEKIGHHGSATCSLTYENSEAQLIGKVGEGFKLMLILMNNARVGVGFEAIGVCQAAYEQAKQYASERVSMGQTIDRHPIVAEMLMDMELDIAAMRAMAFRAANHVEISSRLEMKLSVDPPDDPEELTSMRRTLRRHQRAGRKLTPLVKYAAGEGSVRIARNNMQILGGLGYISEVGATKLLRDALVLPVYEGTSQIQALMCLKDNMTAALSRPATFAKETARLQLLASTTTSETDRMFYKAEASTHQALFAMLARVASGKLRRTVQEKGWGEVKQVADMKSWDPKLDFTQALMHAERFTRAMVDVESARILREQAERFPERQKLAERYVQRMAPRVMQNTGAIIANDTSVLDWIAELGADE